MSGQYVWIGIKKELRQKKYCSIDEKFICAAMLFLLPYIRGKMTAAGPADISESWHVDGIGSAAIYSMLSNILRDAYKIANSNNILFHLYNKTEFL